MQARPMAIAVAIVVIVVAAVVWLIWPGSDVETPAPVAAAPPPTLPEAELPVEEAAPLPELDDSDAFVRELAGALALSPGLAVLLTDDEVARRFVRVVDAVASGESPAGELALLGPDAPFEAAERDGRWFVDPVGYGRYDAVAAAIAAIDVDAALLAFERVEPLLDRAYSDSVGEERPFRPVLLGALEVVIETPETEGTPELLEAVDRFVYRDERLEALALPQKHLLRMGPDNQARIEATLRELAAGLRSS